MFFYRCFLSGLSLFALRYFAPLLYALDFAVIIPQYSRRGKKIQQSQGRHARGVSGKGTKRDGATVGGRRNVDAIERENDHQLQEEREREQKKKSDRRNWKKEERRKKGDGQDNNNKGSEMGEYRRRDKGGNGGRAGAGWTDLRLGNKECHTPVFDTLPLEIVQVIFARLSSCDRVVSRFVGRRWRDAIPSDPRGRA